MPIFYADRHEDADSSLLFQKLSKSVQDKCTIGRVAFLPRRKKHILRSLVEHLRRFAKKYVWPNAVSHLYAEVCPNRFRFGGVITWWVGECAFLQRYAMLARYMLSSCVCLCSVCPSVCSTQAATVPKRLNVGSRNEPHTIARQLWFSGAEYLGEIRLNGVTSTRPPNKGGVCLNLRFLTNMSLYLRNGAR